MPATPGRKPLTPAQAAAYRAIVELCLAGNPPTQRELSRPLGCASPHGCVCHVKVLARKGWVVHDPSSSRGIRPAAPELRVTRAGRGKVTIATTGPVTLTTIELGRLVEQAGA